MPKVRKLLCSRLNFAEKIAISVVLTTLFEHILGAEEELLRERAVKYLAARLKTANAFVLTRDLEDLVVAESKKARDFQTFVKNLPFLSYILGFARCNW